MTTSEGGAVVRTWLAAPLPADVDAALARLAASEGVRRIAVMPDVHLSADVCIGTVVATCGRLYPNAVGGDIGCGMIAQRFEGAGALLEDARAAARVLTGLYARVPATRHPRASAPVLPDSLAGRRLSDPGLEALTRTEGRAQLGTLGSGNHFVELQSDEDGALWVMIDSGSRAMGQAIRDLHLARADPGRRGLRSLDADSDAGRAYLSDLGWALDWADENRAAIARAVAEVVAGALGVAPAAEPPIACHHNAVRLEQHFGEALWVHRKGAISAREGEPGIVPGSMGAPSYHVAGRGHPEALASSAHGAGRALSRTEAARRISVRALERQLEGVWWNRRLAARLRDEAPAAYKDIRAVMGAQRELVRVVRTLRPLLSYKAA